MQQNTSYNGWTNYETWLVKLWMDNDQGSQEFWSENAEQIWKQSNEDTFSRSANARIALAESLKDSHEENYLENVLKPAKAECSVWSDLLGAAMGEVNWHEIAESLLGEVDGYKQAESEVAT